MTIGIGVSFVPPVRTVTTFYFTCPVCKREMVVQPDSGKTLTVRKKCRHVVGIMLYDDGNPSLVMPAARSRKPRKG